MVVWWLAVTGHSAGPVARCLSIHFHAFTRDTMIYLNPSNCQRTFLYILLLFGYKRKITRAQSAKSIISLSAIRFLVGLLNGILKRSNARPCVATQPKSSLFYYFFFLLSMDSTLKWIKTFPLFFLILFFLFFFLLLAITKYSIWPLANSRPVGYFK